MNIQAITTSSCIIRNTASQRGRTTAVEPGTTAARHLRYGRIILGEGESPVRFETGPRDEPDLPERRGDGQNGRQVVRPREIRRDLCASRRVHRSDSRRRRMRSRRVVIACCETSSGSVRGVQRRAERPRFAFCGGRTRVSARTEHPDWQECRGRAPDGRGYIQRTTATGRRGRRTSTRCWPRRRTFT